MGHFSCSNTPTEPTRIQYLHPRLLRIHSLHPRPPHAVLCTPSPVGRSCRDAGHQHPLENLSSHLRRELCDCHRCPNSAELWLGFRLCQVAHVYADASIRNPQRGHLLSPWRVLLPHVRLSLFVPIFRNRLPPRDNQRRWGNPFLYEAYLYHADRLDHRHNFSPYFYLTYLTYPGQSGSPDDHALSLTRRLLRSPLTSLVPQLSLSLGTGLLLGRRTQDLPFAWFVQTFAFVLFNRVCTSQYFLWYTLFLPLLALHVRFSWWSVVAWAGVQAVWLAEAYKLEFLGEDVFFSLWLRSLLYVGGHAWVLGSVMAGYALGVTP